jgi:hypothetical protein
MMKTKAPAFCFSLLVGLMACHARVAAQGKPEPYTKKKTPQVLTVPLPDLLIRNANRVEPGSAKVMIRIANIGKADAGYFQISYVCDWYPKESGKPSFLAGAVIAVESMAAGESKSFEIDCHKNSLIGTKLKFGAMVDWEKKIKESNETNNSLPASYIK